MAKYKLLLPKMGESVEEATIIKWTKNPGDYIEADETVMEIATDKVDSDVPSPVSGRLTEQLFKDNDVVKVGTVIAIIETSEPEEEKIEQAPSFHIPQEQPPVQHTPPPVPAAPVATSSAHEMPPPVPARHARPEEPKPPVFSEQQQVAVPFTEQLQKTEDDNTDDSFRSGGRFYSPLVRNIAAQEGISNEELDKIPGTGAEGRLTKDDLLAYVQEKTQNAAAAPVSEPPKAEPVKEEPKPEPVVTLPQTAKTESVPEQQTAPQEAKPQPVREEPKPEPVMEKPEPVSQPKPEPQEEKPSKSVSLSGGDEIIEMDRMRRLIADHMVMSKQTSPHVTSFVEADVTNLVLWRENIKANFEKREGQKITFTPIFIEAVVRAIKDMPMINVQVIGNQIIKKKDINISMATALPNGNLIVPVIKRADELNLVGLTKAVNDLAGRARSGKLKPDEVQGGTFTITNVGSFGNVMGTPIINQPQVAILAVGAIRKKPAVIETLQGDMIGIRQMMFLSLSYDHRVVDGALGGSFVKRVADYLENWETDREF
ncbi:MAG TPA: 2-oxo acid dehydrogenase subunit E2 [Mucilaginibacter sp.]|nr:2-oxo acid dehydrogenase subunit E2 [Mucilaginibacter sp.]